MYTTCLRCERSLGRNAELPHLPVGCRVAFDTTTGRVWVICTACAQWNLVPTEERWEALADCDRVALEAEARAAGSVVGLARTASGVELLRVGSLPDEEIANWRYGRRLRVRQRWMLAAGLLLGAAAAALGLAAARAFDEPLFGLWIALSVGVWLLMVWRKPPRLWLRLADGRGGRYLLWPWQVGQIHFVEAPTGGPPTLVVPHSRGVAELRGAQAAQLLGTLLPVLNTADSAGVTLARVLDDVRLAETHASKPPAGPTRAARRRARLTGQALPTPVVPRPWEFLADWLGSTRLAYAPAAQRLALEMAVTEELERSAMRAQAETLGGEWREEEEIGRIADDLLVPEAVVERLRRLRGQRESEP